MSSINKGKAAAPKTTTVLDNNNIVSTTAAAAAAARRLRHSDNSSHDQYSPGPVVVVSSSSAAHQQHPQQQLSRYESQKRRDWNTFCQYLKNLQRPSVSVPLSQCTSAHVLDFMRYLDQFGKTKVHLHPCPFFGQPDPPGPCACPLRQAWGSLDALIGRLRAAYEENGGLPETNPFAAGTIRVYLREVRDSQAKARGVPYKKKKKKKRKAAASSVINSTNATISLPSAHHQASASTPVLFFEDHLDHGHSTLQFPSSS